jgi:transposase InsO family protein
MRRYRQQFTVTLMCRVLGVSRAGFYAAERRVPGHRAQHNEILSAVISVIHKTSRQTYGSPRIHREVRAAGLVGGRHRIARLMRKAGLRARRPRRWRPQTTNSTHGYGVAGNLLQRRFNVKESGGPNRFWCGDITYVRTEEGWLYLAVLLDLGSRMVVGWAMRESLEAELSVAALRMALARRQPAPGLLHHTDRGVQYAATQYRELLAAHQITASMSRRANCYDNAVAESFFATLRWELLNRHHWQTHAAARSAIFEYIEVWYNRQRRHSALGYLSPLQFELQLHSAA